MTINLDELEALLAKAAKRPWQLAYSGTVVLSGDDCCVCWPASNDAPLIVAAVNALPELIAEVRLLRQRHADGPPIAE